MPFFLNIKSHSQLSGKRRNGKRKTHGTVEFLTSNCLKRYRRKIARNVMKNNSLLKQLSMTGKLVKSTMITKTKNPYIVSQLSPNTLLCSQCGRSTYTLTLGRTGNKFFIQLRCQNCGTSGLIELENLSGIENSSQIQDTTVVGAHTRARTAGRAGFDQTYKRPK